MGYEIYYFTGTGNSLAIANEIKAKLEGAKVIPIVPLMKRGEKTKGRRRYTHPEIKLKEIMNQKKL